MTQCLCRQFYPSVVKPIDLIYNDEIIFTIQKRIFVMKKYNFPEEKQKLLEELPQAFAVYQFIDQRVRTLILSDGFLTLFGFKDRKEAMDEMDRDMYRLNHPDDAARIANAALRFATEDEPYDVVYRTKFKNAAEYRLVHSKGEHVTTEDGTRLAYIWYMDEGACPEDSDLQKSLEKTLKDTMMKSVPERKIRYDELTGLPEKAYFFPLAIAGTKELRAKGKQPAFLFFDLNGMKFYNTKYSFEEGNKLLRSFGQLLSKTFSNENCCHLGGDHFAAYRKEEGLEKALKTMFLECKQLNDGKSLPVHVGICASHQQDFPITSALDQAKYACDSLRNTYESTFTYYNETLNDDLSYRQYILSHLDQALEEGWIQVYYQPIVRIVSKTICDEEALARWIDPEKGTLSPSRFIPILEESKVIYKLDLYMLDEILKKIKIQKEAGLFLVPQSLNLSRSDFEICDMVEEVRKRVDAAGVPHNLITIEITESTIGNNHDFMKKQIESFQQLGFPVWMDDFGSGYSSIDVMESIRFDLIKFDMSFMQRLNEGESGKTILSELMRMALAMDVDTVCEGVETKEHVQFLREIGCSKLQGYYYSKPISLSELMGAVQSGIHIPYENPAEASYFETMGRINLYDLSIIAGDEEDDFRNYFNTLPMSVLELNGNCTKYIRSNPSYRSFAKRFFHFDLSDEGADGSSNPEYTGKAFMKYVRQCCETGKGMFVDEEMPDGTLVHSYIRKIGENPVTKGMAVVIVVLSVQDMNNGK